MRNTYFIRIAYYCAIRILFVLRIIAQSACHETAGRFKYDPAPSAINPWVIRLPDAGIRHNDIVFFQPDVERVLLCRHMDDISEFVILPEQVERSQLVLGWWLHAPVPAVFPAIFFQ